MIMAKTVAKLIVAFVIACILLMTYLAMTGNDVSNEQYMARPPAGALRHHDRKSDEDHAFQRRERAPNVVEKIHVAYPLEHVPGLQEVMKNPEKDLNSDDEQPVDDEDLRYKNRVFKMPVLAGENIISMTLYGSSRRYTMGALRNAELIKENFPGWKLRIYTETPATSRYGIIPTDVMSSLRALGVDFYFMQPGEDFIPPMMWRFLVADDEWVDRFVVRDADARLTQRDAATVYDWAMSGKPFTCVRDHPSHAGYAISGGMWGGIPRDLKVILRKSWRELMRGVPSDYLQDMNFLNGVIWPKIQKNHAYCLDSVSCDSWPGAYPFPVRRYGYEHVGQVVNDHDLGRPDDMRILRQAGENKNCTRPISYIFKLLEQAEQKSVHSNVDNKR